MDGANNNNNNETIRRVTGASSEEGGGGQGKEIYALTAHSEQCRSASLRGFLSHANIYMLPRKSWL